MADKSSGDKLLYCSFCGKSQHEVRKLIAGPSVFICDECIELCNDIIRDEVPAEGADSKTPKSDLPVPSDLVATEAACRYEELVEAARARDPGGPAAAAGTSQALERISVDSASLPGRLWLG